ncbi:MAG: PAC2 family protein [Dehalococcoidales bacterium]|nr:PAC2 family protein [Dehalococcoidales bacterium]
MRAFELDEPIPVLNEPHAIAILKPWVDVGRAGTVALKWIEDTLGVRDLAKLAKPGDFIDFTRHRPTSYVSAGRRRMTVPNTYVTYSKQETGNDFIFLHLLEPHAHGDEYVESVLDLMKHFGVKRYTIIGSMHDYVPHTRPLIVTGEAVGQKCREVIELNNIESIEYRGPTSICFLISQTAPDMGIESLSLIAHLPQYTQIEEDFTGALRLMNILHNVYGIPVDDKYTRRSERQLNQIKNALESNPQLKTIITQLETHYDTRDEKPEEQETTELSPEIEKFLAEMDKRFREDQSS